MKNIAIFVVGLLIGLSYNNFAAKLFSNEANAKVKAVQQFKLNETTILK